MGRRLLVTTIPSPTAIEKLYAAHPRLASAPYHEQLQAILFESLNGYADAYGINFPKFGHEVEMVAPNVAQLQLQWARENGLNRLARQFSFLSAPAVETLLDKTGAGSIYTTHRRRLLDTVFLEQVRRYRPDILWIALVTPLSPAVIRQARQFATVVVAQLDAPFPRYLDLIDCYDLIFSSYPQFVTCFNESGLPSVHMPLAFEPTFMARCAQRYPGEAPRQHKAVFVGSFSIQHKERMRLMAALAETGLIEFWVSLDNMDKAAVPAAIRQAAHPPVYGLEMYDVYRRARIALNVHAEVSGPYASIFRLFEITGAGAMLLTDDLPNLPDLFQPGVEAITFSSVQDCVDKLIYYLEHEDERAEVARRGQKRTLAEHCFEHRIPRLMAQVEPLLADRPADRPVSRP